MTAFVSVFSAFYLMLMSWLYAHRKLNFWIYISLVCILSSVFSAYFSHDSVAYQMLFERYSTTPFSHFFSEISNHEAFFVLMSKGLSMFPAFVFFCFYALMSFAIKLALIEKGSRDPVLSLLCFFAFFFLYLDGTVIRVSLGIAIAYWGVYALAKNNFLGFFSAIIFSALFFHYSLLVLIIMPIFRTHASIVFIFFSTCVAMIFYFFGLGVLDLIMAVASYLDSSYIGVNKLVSYINRSEAGYPYSTVYLLLFFVSLVSYVLFRGQINDFELILFNMLFFSFFLLVIFYQSQVIQNRLSEIFRYSLVFIVPFYYYSLKRFLVTPKKSMVAYCTFLGGFFFYYYYFKGVISEENLSLLSGIFIEEK